MVASDNVLERRWYNQVRKSILKQRVILASSVEETLRIIGVIKPDVVFTSLSFDWVATAGLRLAQAIKERYSDTYVVLLGGTLKNSSTAIDFTLAKPTTFRQIRAVLESYRQVWDKPGE